MLKPLLAITRRGEKTGEPIKIVDGKFAFPLKAYAPASFVLEEGTKIV